MRMGNNEQHAFVNTGTNSQWGTKRAELAVEAEVRVFEFCEDVYSLQRTPNTVPHLEEWTCERSKENHL